MKVRSIQVKTGLFILFLGIFCQGLFAQNGEKEKEKPNQLDILKVNITQLAVNEARILYEMQVGEVMSLEFGGGFIYPNNFWFQQGGRTMLATGFGLYMGFRKYLDPQRYFSEPKTRTYFSWMAFYRRSWYKNKWFLFSGDPNDPNQSECELMSENINQIGLVTRFGWQRGSGRIVWDLYGGIGVKMQPSVLTSHAINDSSNVCEILPTTEIGDQVLKETPAHVILNAGLRIGLRRNNRERNFKERKKSRGFREDDPESPPEFRP